MISWNVSKTEHDIIMDIAYRAHAIAKKQGVPYDLTEIMMDLTATHANGCPLKLAELAGASPFDFTHDVFGIRNHIDRSTGQLRDGFCPRYTDLKGEN